MIHRSTNPFPVVGYKGPEYFCDREDEIQQLKNAVISGRNSTLIALRRMGKTALIQHLFHILEKDSYRLVYLDLMPTTSLRDLNSALVTALARAFPEKSNTGKKIWQWIKSIRPTVTYDPYSGQPTVSVGFDKAEEQMVSIADAFKLMDLNTRPTVVAFDEFQQITQYPEKQTEAWLRSQIQQLKNTTFVFSGSQQTILQEMFLSAKRPFYASTELLQLDYIRFDTYRSFISEKFSEADRKIADEEINTILNWCRGHTYYVQTICNRLFGREQKEISPAAVKAEMQQILKEQEGLFYTYRDLMTAPQWNLLKSIAKEDKLYAPTGSAFISKYKLGAAATIQRSLTSLLNNELIFRVTDAEGAKYYQVYDVFLSRWLETSY